jgi:ribulose-5-phosphate 4-epimerase/fuculose-1-phosphate aldolase
MNIASPPATLSGVADEEWKIRCDLAALYRLIAHFKWTDLIYTHISARLPGHEDHFLINDYSKMFHEMRASDLVKVDMDGNLIDEPAMSTRHINAAGFCIHSAIHMNRPDLMCVVHTHTAAGIAVSAQKLGLLPISQHALRFYDHLAYHDYEGIAMDLGERDRLVTDLGPHKAMILRNHGLLACGRSIPEAFLNIYILERACEAQIRAQSGGAELVFPPEEVCAHTARQFNGSEGTEAHYANMWQAAVRLIEQDRPDFRG